LKRASSETPGVGDAGKSDDASVIVILGIQTSLEGSSLFKHFAFNFDGLVSFNRMVHNYRYDLLITSRAISSLSVEAVPAFLCCFTIPTQLYHEDVFKHFFPLIHLYKL
jgi:hypothetical protein